MNFANSENGLRGCLNSKIDSYMVITNILKSLTFHTVCFKRILLASNWYDLNYLILKVV